MSVRLVVSGAFLLVLGIALMSAGPTIVLSAYDSANAYQVLPSAGMSIAHADLVLELVGIVLAPIGAAMLSYGIVTRDKSPPKLSTP